MDLLGVQLFVSHDNSVYTKQSIISSRETQLLLDDFLEPLKQCPEENKYSGVTEGQEALCLPNAKIPRFFVLFYV